MRRVGTRSGSSDERAWIVPDSLRPVLAERYGPVYAGAEADRRLRALPLFGSCGDRVTAQALALGHPPLVGIVDFATGEPDNSWRTRKSFFCSALGIWVLWKAGMLGIDVLVPFTNIDPGAALDVYWGLGARKAATPIGLRV